MIPDHLADAVAAVPKAQRELVERLLQDPSKHVARPLNLPKPDARPRPEPPPRRRTPDPPRTFPAPTVCPHEGAIVDRWRTDCKARQERLSVRECRHPETPGLCVREDHPLHASVRLCHGRNCPLTGGTFVRHLLYHIYPVLGNGAWERNVARLVERLPLFDGRRVVAIAVDPPERKPDPTHRRVKGCADPEDVMAAFGGWRDRVEFLVEENDPALREVKTLVPLLDRLPTGDRDVALYAQAKGTARPRGHVGNHWGDTLYEIYCDFWPLVDEQLRTFPVTGAYKKIGRGFPGDPNSLWHYSGSWAWFRVRDVKDRPDWRAVTHDWFGVEPYWSHRFPEERAGCLFWEGPGPAMNLYDRRLWRNVIDPALDRWKASNRRT